VALDILAQVSAFFTLRRLAKSSSVPIGVTAIIILYFVWPSNKNITDVADWPSFKQMDFLGAALNATFSILFVFGLQGVGIRRFAWDSAAAICLLIAAGVTASAFYLWQWYISHGKISLWILPQLPFRIIKHRPMAVAIM
jgi:protein-S-isoprenylcysteine O-methyltransferase Ste14